MKRGATLFGLLLIDLGGFVVTASFLPKKGGWSHSGPVSYFINSRQHWDVAWGIFIALLIISAGIYSLLNAKGVFENAKKVAPND